MNQRTGFASVLWSSCLAMLAVGANSTAIMAALPSMRTELSLSSAGVEWAVNAYLVVSAAFIVLGGQAADRFGARLASMAGLALFGVAILHHCRRRHASRAAGRTGLARPRGSVRGAQHAGCGRHQRGAGAQGSSDRRLDRVPDARLQHRAAARRRAHARHRLACDLLAQRPADVEPLLPVWPPQARRPPVLTVRKAGARIGSALFCWPR